MSTPPPRKRLPLFLFAGIGLLLICCVAGFLVVKTAYDKLIGEPPGVGAKAELGYQTCQPIIDALQAYNLANNAYPEDLNTLEPGFLPVMPARANEYLVNYTKTETSYSLKFTYEGPGLNTCVYTPEAGWSCSGLY